MLHVSLVSTDYLPNIGGVATHVHELARGLARSDDVQVVTFTHGSVANLLGGAERRHEFEGVPVRTLRVGSLPNGHLRYWQLRKEAARLSRGLPSSTNPRVSHAHDLSYGAYLARNLTSDLLVFTNHTSGFLQDIATPGGREFWRQNLDAFDHVIAPSHELRQRTIELGLAEERVSFVPNGVDPGKYRPNPEARQSVRQRLSIPGDQTVIILTRRFVPKNGVIDFAHSLRHLRDVADKITIVMAGNGYAQEDPLGYEKETLAAIAQSPLADRVRLLGPVPNKEIMDLYAAADISVLPSLKEAISISGLEAMASGLALVGTNVGGIPELITHRATGLLVEPGDPRGLAEAIHELIRDAELRVTLGANAAALVRSQFSWQHVAGLTRNVYLAALERKRDAARRSTESA